MADDIREMLLKQSIEQSQKLADDIRKKKDNNINSLIGMPEGYTFDELPPNIRLDILAQNTGIKNFKSLFDKANEDLQANAKMKTITESTVKALNDFGYTDDVSEKERNSRIDTNFGWTNNVFGVTDKDEGLVKTPLATIRSGISSIGNDDFNEGRSAKSTMAGINFLKAYESLKGAGQISNFEGDKAQAAFSVLFNDTTTDETARYHLDVLNQIMRRAQYRSSENIWVDSQGNEWLNRRGEDPKRVYSGYDESLGRYTYIEVEKNKFVPELDSSMSIEQLESIRNNLQLGDPYIWDGNIKYVGGQQ